MTLEDDRKGKVECALAAYIFGGLYSSISRPPLSSDCSIHIHAAPWPRNVSEGRRVAREDVQCPAQLEATSRV